MSLSQQLMIKKALSQAKIAMSKGDSALALKHYNSVLEQKPNHPIARKSISKLHKALTRNQSGKVPPVDPPQEKINTLINMYYSGQMSKTEQACQELLQTYPKSLVILNLQGASFYGQGKLREAVESYNKAIQIKPDYAETYSNRGVAFQELGQLKEALEDYNKAIQIKPDYAEAYSNRGNALKELGQLKESVESYNKAIRIKPDYAEAFSNRGNAFQELGQPEKAVESYNKAIRIKPDYAEAYYNRGLTLKQLGQVKEAVESYNKAIRIKPDHAEAYSNRGNALKQLGHIKEAVESYNKAIQIKPDYAEAYYNRGSALKELGQLKEAVKSYNKAIRIKPDYAGAYSNRGNALKQLGHIKEAVASYNKAIRIKPDYAEAYSNRGNTLKELGQLKEAVESYNKAIRIKPDYAEAYSNRGVAFKELGQLKEAVESYTKAIQIKPDHAEAYSNRGNAFQELGQLKKAVESYNTAIRIKPDYADAYYNLGNAFQELGRPKEALESYNKAIQIKPDCEEAYSNRGNALKELGQLKEAVESYNKAILIKPDCAEAYYNLSSTKKYKPQDTQIGIIKNLFECSAPNGTDRRHLSFTLAKAYDDIGEYDKSFDYLKEGNRLRKKELNYNIDNDRRLFARIKDVFSAGNLAPDVIPDRKRPIQPIFILGMPRSGTSLVEQILASHTKVHGAGELNIMANLVNSILPNLPDQNPNQGGREWQNEITTLGDAYLKALEELKIPEKIITDKMPLNFRYIGFILSALPEAKIVHLNRDPKATCWSIYKQSFSSQGNGYAYDMNDLAEFFKLYIDLMSFWREQFPNGIYDLCYEELTENQEEETRKLLTYCGLEWDEQCLYFHKTQRAVKTASAVQVREKMYKGSSEAWRKYEEYLQPLTKKLINLKCENSD